MLTLYGDLDSGNVYKVRLLLAQLGVTYRRVDTTQNRGETATAEFRAINPIGKIPTIVFDDGRMLSESGAILYFLARDTALFPADAWDQANVLRWMFFEQYSHEPALEAPSAVGGAGAACRSHRPESHARRTRADGNGAAAGK